MARIVLTNNAKFRPYSFDEMLKPLAMATQEYNAIEEGIAELGSKADLMRMYANEEPNSKVANMYNTYANDLDKQAESLAKQGLSPASRGSLLGLKRRYSSEIIPIETAVTRRRQLAEEQRKARAQDDSILFDIDARTMSLDDLVNNPELSYSSASGKNIMENVSKAASVLAKEARNDPNKFNSVLGGDYYEYVKQYGFSKEAVMDAILRSKNASNILTSIVDDALASSGVGKNWSGNAYDRALDYANRGLWSAVGQTQTQLVDNWRAKMEAQANKELEVARTKAGLSGKDKNKLSNIDRTSYYFTKDRLEIPKLLNEEGKLKRENTEFLFKNGKFTKPADLNTPQQGSKKNMMERISESDYYHNINNILLNSGFSQEAINNMNKETIESNLKAITELNAADAVGRNIYRFALDENATEHLLGKVGSRGLKVQELEGFDNGIGKYSNPVELVHEKGQSGDILFDAKSKDFMVLYQGHYYKLPKGMISNDLYNEIEGYLATDKEGNSNFSRAKEVFDFLSEKASKNGLESLTEKELKAYLNARDAVYSIDTRLGEIGKEFVKYVGTKNTTN